MILKADFSDATGESNRGKGPIGKFKADIDQLKYIEVPRSAATDQACDNDFCTLGIRCCSQLY